MAGIFKLRTLATVTSVGAVAGVLYLQDPRASAYRYLIMPIGRAIIPDGEKSHRAAVEFMRFPFLNPKLPKRWIELADTAGLLRTSVFGADTNADLQGKRVKKLELATPIGLAAGYDKNGEAIDTLFNLGFSWVEIGSVTPEPQEGNPKPRVFRLPEDKAFINRYGFNSEGHAAVAARLELRESKIKQSAYCYKRPGQFLAVNLGKNKTGDEINDYVKGVRAFGTLADALVVNVSSPNTPGLRDLQGGAKLTQLLDRLVKERNQLPIQELPPLLVKIAPDVNHTQIKAIAEAVQLSGIDGVIVGNTTIGRPGPLKSNPDTINQTGGLSGPPVKPLELQALRLLRKELPRLPIVGCGGVQDARDALEFAKAGADFVQLYTSFAYDGPEKPSVIAEDLVKLLDGQNWPGLRK